MEQLDQNVVNLAKAIRQIESGNRAVAGKSGELASRYQYTPGTWKSVASKYLGDPNAPVNLENENKATYLRIKDWKDAGYNVGQIASMWNAGEGRPNAYAENWRGTNKYGVKYDTPAYAEKVAKYYQELKNNNPNAEVPITPSTVGDNQGIEGNIQQPQQEQGGYKPWLPATPGESALSAAGKAAVNTIPSALNFGKEVVSSLNPLNTVSSLSQIPGEFSGLKSDLAAQKASEQGLADINNKLVQQYKKMKAEGKDTKRIENSMRIAGIDPSKFQTPNKSSGLLMSIAKEVPKAGYQTLVPKAGQQLLSGDISGAGKTLTEDPFGQAAPVVIGVRGLAGSIDALSSKVGKPTNIAGTIDTGIERVGQSVTKPVGKVATAVSDAVGNISASLASHLTSLDPATIKTVLSRDFTKIAQEQANRGGLAGEIKTGIESRIKNLEDTGKGYEPIRADNTPLTSTHAFDFAEILKKNGLELDQNGKISSNTKSVTRNPSDIRALQRFADNWFKNESLTPNEVLNMRSDAAALKYNDMGLPRKGAVPNIANEFRKSINEQLRPQVKGLEALDDTYSKETALLKQFKKDFLNRDGTFKDNAPSKIANALSKEGLLARLEELVPNIKKRIEILKAVEDIERASGIKVGGYTRSILQGASIVSGNIPGIIATIITHPSNAVKILRSTGYLGRKAAPIIKVLKVIGGDVTTSKTGLLPSLAQSRATQ